MLGAQLHDPSLNCRSDRHLGEEEGPLVGGPCGRKSLPSREQLVRSPEVRTGRQSPEGGRVAELASFPA